jgi:Gpi18-like mannosyltransferase
MMTCKQRVLAWLLLAFAVLNKPPVLVLGPLFFLEAFLTSDARERAKRLVQTGGGILGAVVLGYLLALPFYTDWSFFGVYHRMISWYQIGSSLYPFTSANAFNVYALFGDFFRSDNTTVLLMPLKYWADLTFIVIFGLILWCYVRKRDEPALLEASFLTMLAFFLVLTEMHERYLIYALTFIPVLAVIHRRYLWSAGVLTLTQWLNLEYSLTYMWVESDKPPGIDPQEFAPVLVHLCALANIGVFMVAGNAFLKDETPALGKVAA